MPNESMMRVFKIDDGTSVVSYPIRDSHINIAYGECVSSAASTNKDVTLTDDPGWKLVSGAIAVVHFTNGVPANATMDIASTGIKSIYLKNAAIGNSIIIGGDIVTFVYDGTKYVITAIDRLASDIHNKLETSLKGSANGLAELDVNGKVPSSQLPSYVDDVIEGYFDTITGKFYQESSKVNEISGESGKIYIDLNTEKTYRWSGSIFVVISETLALGETSSTAYRGDRGKTAYDHATDSDRLTTPATEGFYKVSTSAEGHVKSVSAVQQSDITGLGIATEAQVNTKADKTDTVLETTVSRGRKANTTVGTGSFAFGNDVTASGLYSLATGFNTAAVGSYAHAEGGGTTARVYSHAEGYQTRANGDCSHSEGSYTIAQRKSQRASGEYNVADETGTASTRGDFAEIVGNGTAENARSNARALDWNGNEYLNGSLYVNCDANSENGNKVATETDTVLNTTLSRGRKANTTVGTGSFAFGDNVEASGSYSHAEGSNTTATNSNSHAEGVGTAASGQYSHAEGMGSFAANLASHAEGLGTIASADYSHAEGNHTTASGRQSHAEGYYTIAARRSQHVVGQLNVEDNYGSSANNYGKYIEIVGNGEDSDERSNARAVDWNGNEYLKGNLYVNCGADSTGGVLVMPMMPSSPIAIPEVGATVTYDMVGLTANHRVSMWNFSESAENIPPASLSIVTSADSFTVTNNDGVTTEYFQPVFTTPILSTCTVHPEPEPEEPEEPEVSGGE